MMKKKYEQQARNTQIGHMKIHLLKIKLVSPFWGCLLFSWLHRVFDF